jgi:hypothetical protein
MDALSFMHADVTAQSVTCDVYRDDGDTSYGSSGASKVGTADVAIYAPESTSEVVVEGSGQETSLTGLVVPERDDAGDLVHNVKVNDELRVQSQPEKRYEVRVKDGFPNELSPELWRLGLDRANSSA